MKKILLILIIALFCVPWVANAQTTVTIGEGTATSYNVPIGTFYNYSITEMLYTAEEIGMAGTISQNDNNVYDLSTVPGSATSNRPNIQLVIFAGSGTVCEKPIGVTVGDITPHLL